ncbi:MAG TPA: 50S ribosomal protein L24 [Verrucomicrobiae bacterium]|nr:50S ribosomal protein L24 [Verrucomicrobiae bacterium]
MNSLHIKRNDVVVVRWGEDRGKIGRVLATFPEKGRVLVEGVNVVTKALRKSQERPKGGIITKEAPIAVSKVMLQERYEVRRKKHAAPAKAEA